MNRQTKSIVFASLLFLSTGHLTKAGELEGFDSSLTITEANREVLSSKQFRSSWFSRGRSEKFDQSALDEIEISLKNEPNTNLTNDSSGNPALNYLAGLMPSINGSSQNVLSNKIFSDGKSLLVDVICGIASGKPAAVMSQGKDEAETEKRLHSAALRGDDLIAIDNCEAPLKGDTLCQILTQPTISIRPLGVSRLIDIEKQVVLLLLD